jgi:hypothetical protein
MKFMITLYRAVLRFFNLGDRRCGWCQRWLGFTRGLRGGTSHGMCEPCAARWEAEAVQPQARASTRRRTQQRPAWRTLRRRTGGWGGAVACR